MTANRKALVSITTWLPIFAAFVAVVWFGTTNATTEWEVASDAQIMDIRGGSGSPSARLLAKSDCDLPKDVIPGHAVISPVGKGPRLVKADAGFAIWLGPDGVERTGDEAPGTLHGFCR